MTAKEISQKRLDFGSFVDRIFWAIIIGMFYLAISEFRDMSDNIAALNEKMATVVSEIGYHSNILRKHDKRIEKLETPD